MRAGFLYVYYSRYDNNTGAQLEASIAHKICSAACTRYMFDSKSKKPKIIYVLNTISKVFKQEMGDACCIL